MHNSKRFVVKYFSIFWAIMISSLPLADALLSQSLIQVNVIQPSYNGQKVGVSTVVKGTAVLPSNNFLWILAHRIKGYEDHWWPQGEVQVDAQDSTWVKNVQFGEERDIGYQFEIAIITVGKTEHEKLRQHLFKGMKSGVLNPMSMPPTTSPPEYRIVTKVSH